MKGEKRRKEKIVPPHPFPIEESAEALGDGGAFGVGQCQSKREEGEKERKTILCSENLITKV
jgi:hypothetical protein